MGDILEWMFFVFWTALAAGAGWHGGSTLIARYFWPAGPVLSYDVEVGQPSEEEEEAE